ncbi:Putative 3-hydroxymethyl-3-methylglutaryl-CoA lyase 2 [Myotis brandtii]|uniref:Putative 3-hydroxymethyl-3-methylglutaryl-CoA lyase 2 n=1 Tax=Myotis brandtii TaxID=109478 RepID=S7P755_MYOBR|nr:Putative 3-hydroxymethyl-3-methylglutaryl-CoA lyase 2 [Myotis brandtii]
MGNVPSAVKHCLSYQQLLREHLWIADSVPGALDPAQVPPRGPGCPHPLAYGPRASPRVVISAPHGPPFLQRSAVRGLTLDKVSQHLSAVNM